MATRLRFDPLGTEATVQKLQAGDLKSFHQRLVTPDNCVLAIYGDVKADEVKAAVEKAFVNWKPRAGSAGRMPASGKDPGATRPQNAGAPSRVEELRDKKQAVLVVGFPGTTMFDDDRYALELIQESCSDLGSRLFLRIRERLGLAYYVGAQNLAGIMPGYFAFYTGTDSSTAKNPGSIIAPVVAASGGTHQAWGEPEPVIGGAESAIPPVFTAALPQDWPPDDQKNFVQTGW